MEDFHSHLGVLLGFCYGTKNTYVCKFEHTEKKQQQQKRYRHIKKLKTLSKVNNNIYSTINMGQALLWAFYRYWVIYSLKKFNKYNTENYKGNYFQFVFLFYTYI